MFEKLNGLPWSAFCNLGFILLGAFQLFPGIVPSLAISQPIGGAVFVAVFSLLLIASVLATVHDRADLQFQRDGITRLQTELEGVNIRLDRMEERDTKKRELELTSGKGSDSPEVRELDRQIAATHEAQVRVGEIFKIANALARARPGARAAHLTITPAAVDQQLKNAAGTEELPSPEKDDT